MGRGCVEEALKKVGEGLPRVEESVSCPTLGASPDTLGISGVFLELGGER